MIDPRNRPALIGSVIAGVTVLVGLWFVGLAPTLAWMAAWTVPAFAMYGIDKRQAASGGWRVPEELLHGLALVGGVLGAWAGRAVFRHKTQKPVFTIVLIVASILWLVIAGWALLG